MIESPFVILNGFDRSGTSAISRTLSNHDQIELLMQPFNSSFIRKRMYEAFGNVKGKDMEEAIFFFEGLKNNHINNNLIKSEWYFKYSTTQEYVPGKIHIIKTTINHFAQKWMKENFPDIHVWGIWRDPKEIVSSIIRNNFYGNWYNEALELLKPTIETVDFLKENYLHLIASLNTDIKRTAFLIAVRTHFFLYYLDQDKLIDYAIFKKDAKMSLKSFCDFYNLKNIDFNEYSKKDLNIIGDPYIGQEEFMISSEEEEFINLVFKKINLLKKEKFTL